MASKLTIRHAIQGMEVCFQQDAQGREIIAPLTSFQTPLSENDQEELRWYLEDYLHAPAATYDQRAQKVLNQLESWGELLFHSIFPIGSRAYQIYQRASSCSDAELWLRSDSPAFLGLPWELCRDPERKEGLISIFPGLTRSLITPVPSPIFSSDLPLRILMIISRPDGTPDLNYQLLALPLMQMLRHVRENVQMDVLRPPTIDAFRLSIQRAQQEGWPYQIIHFDGHGVFSKEQFENGSYVGPRARLVFETAGGLPHPVSIHELIELMGGTDVPLFVLNACHSATLVRGMVPEATIATRLLQEGITSVVAMSYGLFADAASYFVPSFYLHLLKGQSVARAVEAGRDALRRNPRRRTLIGDKELQDWLIPVYFANQTTVLSPPILDHSVDLTSFQWESDFVGRDRDFHALEQILRTHRVVLLHGIAGIGKTEFANRFATWLGETGAVEDLSSIHFLSLLSDDRLRSLEDLLDEIGKATYGSLFTSTYSSSEKKADAILSWLKVHRGVVVFDSLELNKPHWTNDDLNIFRELINRTNDSEGATILITSRSEETWLDKIPRYELRGIDNLAVGELEEIVCKGSRRVAEEPVRSFSLADLNGHPECLRFLFTCSEPQPISFDLLGDPRKSLPAKRVESAFYTLSPTDRHRILALSLSTGFVDLQLLKFLTGYFSKERKGEDDEWRKDIPTRFGPMDFEFWEASLDACVTAGLASKHDDFNYQLHPVLPPFLLDAWRREAEKEFDQELALYSTTHLRAVIGLAYQLCFKLAVGSGISPDGPLPSIMRGLDPDYLRQQMAGYYPQVAKALISALHAGELTLACLTTDFLTMIWQEKPDNTERLRICTLVSSILDSHQDLIMDGAEGTLRLFALQNRVHSLDYGQPATEIQQECERMLKAVEGRADEHGRERQGSLCWSLGILFDKVGLLDKAENYLKRAIREFRSLDDQASVSRVKHSLAIVQERQGQEYSARELFSEVGAEYMTPSEEIEHMNRSALQAFEKGNYDEATASQLRILAAAKDNPTKLARAMHELGLIAWACKNLAEAEQWFRDALAIKSQLSDHSSTANTILELGSIALKRKHFDEADSWYLEALRLLDKGGSVTRKAMVHIRLAELAERRGADSAALDSVIRAIMLFPKLYDQGAANALPFIGRVAASHKVDAFLHRWQALAGSPPSVKLLIELGEVLQETGHCEEALQIAHNLIEGTESNPPVQSAERAAALLLFARCSSLLEDLRDSLAIVQEAAGIYEQLAADNPEKFDEDLAVALRGVATLTAAKEGPAAALPIIEKSIAIHRKSLSEVVGVSHTLLGHALGLFAQINRELGLQETALIAEQERTEIFRACRKVERAYSKWLVEPLYHLAELTLKLGLLEQAREASAELYGIYALEYEEEERISAFPAFAEVVNIYVQCLDNLDESGKATTICEESAAVLERNIGRHSSAASQYVFVLLRLVARFQTCGDLSAVRDGLRKFTGLVASRLLTAEAVIPSLEFASRIAFNLKETGQRTEAQTLLSALSELETQHPSSLQIKAARVQIYFDLTLGSEIHLELSQIAQLCCDLKEAVKNTSNDAGLRLRRGFAIRMLLGRHCEKNLLDEAIVSFQELEEWASTWPDERHRVSALGEGLFNLISVALRLCRWETSATYYKTFIDLVRCHGSSEILSHFDEISFRSACAYAEKQQSTPALNVIEAIAALAKEHPDPSKIFDVLLKTTNNFLIRCRPSTAIAKRLYEKFSSLVTAHPNEASLRSCLGMCCLRYVEVNVANGQLAIAGAAFDDLAEIAKSEKFLGLLLIWAGGPLIQGYLQANDLDLAKSTFVKVVQYIPDELPDSELPEQFAGLSHNVIGALLTADKVDGAKEAYAHFRAFALQHSENDVLAEALTIHCINLLGTSAQLSEVGQLYEDLLAITHMHATARFYELYIMGSVNAIYSMSISGERPDLGEEIFDRLISLRAKSADPNTEQALISSGLNLITGYCSLADYDAASLVLLKTIANASLEVVMSEPTREAAIRIIKGYFSAQNRAGAASVLNATRALFQTKEAVDQLLATVGPESADCLRSDTGFLINE